MFWKSLQEVSGLLPEKNSRNFSRICHQSLVRKSSSVIFIDFIFQILLFSVFFLFLVFWTFPRSFPRSSSIKFSRTSTGEVAKSLLRKCLLTFQKVLLFLVFLEFFQQVLKRPLREAFTEISVKYNKS